jgi:hypothetical protein
MLFPLRFDHFSEKKCYDQKTLLTDCKLYQTFPKKAKIFLKFPKKNINCVLY